MSQLSHEHPDDYEDVIELRRAAPAERKPAVCPKCGRTSSFSGTVAWCPCSGWLDEVMA